MLNALKWLVGILGTLLVMFIAVSFMAGADIQKITMSLEAQATQAAVDPNRGITFGKPIVRNKPAPGSLLVLATNTTPQIMTFTANASFVLGETVAGMASGRVNNLLPGQKRAVLLLLKTPLPAKYDSIGIEVENAFIEDTPAPTTIAASQISFGKPTVKTANGLAQVDVDVNNADGISHTLTVQATFLNGPELVGMASALVDDLPAHESKKVTLTSERALPAYTHILVAIDSMVN